VSIFGSCLAKFSSEKRHLFAWQAAEIRNEDGLMQGARSTGTGMHFDVHEDSEHRATPQMTHRSSIAAPAIKPGPQHEHSQ
jgi:hypothetical protein